MIVDRAVDDGFSSTSSTAPLREIIYQGDSFSATCARRRQRAGYQGLQPRRSCWRRSRRRAADPTRPQPGGYDRGVPRTNDHGAACHDRSDRRPGSNERELAADQRRERVLLFGTVRARAPAHPVRHLRSRRLAVLAVAVQRCRCARLGQLFASYRPTVLYQDLQGDLPGLSSSSPSSACCSAIRSPTCSSQLPRRVAGFCMIFVILPFWTSVLVRTYAWLVILQRNGLVNDWLGALGLIGEPLQLVHNFAGVVVGMSHVLLPFLVLPLYASMRAIDRDYIRAAMNLGASPLGRVLAGVLPAVAARAGGGCRADLRALPWLLRDSRAHGRWTCDHVGHAHRADRQRSTPTGARRARSVWCCWW